MCSQKLTELVPSKICTKTARLANRSLQLITESKDKQQEVRPPRERRRATRATCSGRAVREAGREGRTGSL